jgi:1,2-phenylacetyl-CoA epoxidase PaaB subunit
MSICCVLSGRCPCDELITRPEESYRLWCVVMCDLETSPKRRPRPTEGCRTKNKQKNYNTIFVKFKKTSMCNLSEVFDNYIIYLFITAFHTVMCS